MPGAKWLLPVFPPSRAEGKIKHCRVQQEGQTVLLGNTEFDSLVDLISYHEKHPLYRKMKLRYPINEETLEKIGTAVSAGATE